MEGDGGEVKDGWLRRVYPRATRRYDFRLIGYRGSYNFFRVRPAGSRGRASVRYMSGAPVESLFSEVSINFCNKSRIQLKAD